MQAITTISAKRYGPKVCRITLIDRTRISTIVNVSTETCSTVVAPFSTIPPIAPVIENGARIHFKTACRIEHFVRNTFITKSCSAIRMATLSLFV